MPKDEIWYDFWTNQSYDGGQWIEVEAPIHRIPLFVRKGTILPVCEAIKSSNNLHSENLSLYVYGEDASAIIYEDAGDGYGYEKEEYRITKLNWSPSTHNQQSLSIEILDGKYRGRDYTNCKVIRL